MKNFSDLSKSEKNQIATNIANLESQLGPETVLIILENYPEFQTSAPYYEATDDFSYTEIEDNTITLKKLKEIYPKTASLNYTPDLWVDSPYFLIFQNSQQVLTELENWLTELQSENWKPGNMGDDSYYDYLPNFLLAIEQGLTLLQQIHCKPLSQLPQAQKYLDYLTAIQNHNYIEDSIDCSQRIARVKLYWDTDPMHFTFSAIKYWEL